MLKPNTSNYFLCGSLMVKKLIFLLAHTDSEFNNYSANYLDKNDIFKGVPNNVIDNSIIV